MRKVTMLALAALLIGYFVGEVQAQEQFFKGKQIRIIVGLSSGGGYDRAARLVARYMPKYIPGNPDMVVQNMPRARSPRDRRVFPV